MSQDYDAISRGSFDKACRKSQLENAPSLTSFNWQDDLNIASVAAQIQTNALLQQILDRLPLPQPVGEMERLKAFQLAHPELFPEPVLSSNVLREMGVPSEEESWAEQPDKT